MKTKRGMPGSKPWLHPPASKEERDKSTMQLIAKIARWQRTGELS